MSAAAAAAFLNRVEEDEALAAELTELRERSLDAVHSRVQELGYDATPDEIRSAFLERYGAELDEEQLATIAGGYDDVGPWVAIGVFGGLFAAAAAAAF